MGFGTSIFRVAVGPALNILRVGSVKTTNFIVNHKYSDTFRLIQSSAGQFLKHILGTSSESAHFWDPKMFSGYKWSWYYYNNNNNYVIVVPTSFVCTFSYNCKHFGIPKMCTFTWCILDMVQELAWWWLFVSKHVAKFMADNTVRCVLAEHTLRIFSENTTGWLQLKKKKKKKICLSLRTKGRIKKLGVPHTLLCPCWRRAIGTESSRKYTTITMTVQYQIIVLFAFDNGHLAVLRLSQLYTPTEELQWPVKWHVTPSVAQRLTDSQLHSIFFPVFWIVWLRMRAGRSRNSAVCTVTKPRARQPRNFGSIPLRNKGFSSFSKRRYWIRLTPAPNKENRGLFPQD